MPVKVKVTLTIEDMTEFMIYHIYTGGAGILVLGLGALNVGLTAAFLLRAQIAFAAVFLLFALLLLLGFPRMIRNKVKTLKNSRRLTEAVEYEFSEEGVKTTTSEKTGTVPWKRFAKAVSRRHILILYDAQRKAVILPREQLAEQYGAVVDMIRGHMPPGAVRIKEDGKSRS